MDKFANHSVGLESPAYHAANLTPDDGVDLATVTRAIWVGTAGDLSVVLVSGDIVSFSNASGWMPLRAIRINATGTSADNLVGVW